MNAADLAPRRPLSLFINFAPGVFTDHESNGEGLIVQTLADGLARRGHNVRLLAGRIALKNPSHPNLHVEAVGTHRVPFNSLAPWEYQARAEAYQKSLMRTQSLDMVWRVYGGAIPRPLRTFGLPLALGPIQYPWPQMDGSAQVATGGRPRLGLGLGALTAGLLERGQLAARARADLLLYETRQHADKMRSPYPRATVASIPLIVAVPEGSDDTTPRRLHAHEPTLRLLFAANLYPNKRCEVFCRTVGALRGRHGIDVIGTVLGDGPERARLEALCRDTPEIGDAIVFRGKVPNTEVYGAVGEADFFVSTSVGEPYGRAIAEAMAMGTPPVCHRSGGPGDYIENGRTGLLVDIMAPDAYADAIAGLSRDPIQWAEISANARTQARTEWTSAAVLERLENLFVSLCEKR